MANYNSFSLLSLAIVTLLLASQNADALIPVNQFCKTATYKILCTRMVHGATNLQDASASAIKVAIHVANKIRALTPVVVQAASDLDPTMKSQIVDTCKESFENTIEDLNLSLDLLRQGDMGGVGTRLSAAFDSDCLDALKEQGVAVPSLVRIYSRFEKVMDNSLAVAFQS
ncbi:uncharacterized protein LOC113752757 [Coffea eugenioides]|uniref:Pectinesterase inhibitor domain-containing protein n=1 Tax=Coffea arabica TaxID=13443 RepID=A0ABM4W922_COFAR|nr:uncharacterized protein LOC113752757 [Coffea eugenioides]